MAAEEGAGSAEGTQAPPEVGSVEPPGGEEGTLVACAADTGEALAAADGRGNPAGKPASEDEANPSSGEKGPLPTTVVNGGSGEGDAEVDRESQLLLNDLMDEIGACDVDNELSTPPGQQDQGEVTGEGTPSDAYLNPLGGSSIRSTPQPSPILTATAVSPWGWRTDIPEFVPGNYAMQAFGLYEDPNVGPHLLPPSPCGTGGALFPVGMTLAGGGEKAIVGGHRGRQGCEGGCLGGPSIWNIRGAEVTPLMTWGTVVPMVGRASSSCGCASTAAATGDIGGGGPAASASAAGGPAGAASPSAQPGGTSASGGSEAAAEAAIDVGDDPEAQQLQAQYLWQLRQMEEELRAASQGMLRAEQRRQEVRRERDRERQGLMREIARYVNVLRTYAIPLEEAAIDDPMPEPQRPWAPVPTSSLDAKMRRLNGLLLEDPPRKRSSEDEPLVEGEEEDLEGLQLPASSIASTLQAMFPHATIRTQPTEAPDNEGLAASSGAEGGSAAGAATGVSVAGIERCVGAMADAEVSTMAGDLERLTESQIDDRALRALQGLNVSDALEVLRKVDDLVQLQGGRCRNLSSILQSVCRKLERRAAGRSTASTSAAAAPAPTGTASAASAALPPEGGLAGTTSSAASVGQRAPEPQDAERDECSGADASEDDGSGRHRSCRTRTQRRKGGEEKDTDNGRDRDTDGDSDDRQENGTQGGLRHGEGESEGSCDEGDNWRGPPRQPSEDHWTPQRVERAAQRGFELRRRGGDRWELKVTMGSLEPPLTEAGIGSYCQWLRGRLMAFREEHGVQPLRRCAGELDFSNNGLSNQAVWMLLETLAQCEVQAASLKLYKNRISEGGVLAMCEFIRANRRAGAVHEMHLSHNEIDDESALELLRTLKEQRPRYPPRRPVEGAPEGDRAVLVQVPVWVRLNQNRIRDPATALRCLESEGITFCAARNAHGCGPGKCAKAECPLVHLYLFADQGQRRPRDRDQRAPHEDADSATEQPAAAQGWGEGEAWGARRQRRKPWGWEAADGEGYEAETSTWGSSWGRGWGASWDSTAAGAEPAAGYSATSASQQAGRQRRGGAGIDRPYRNNMVVHQ